MAESLTASQRASLALEAADHKPNPATIHVSGVPGRMADANDASGSIYVSAGESKLAYEGKGQRDQHDADELMTLNPNAQGQFLDDDEEMHLTMGNTKMASKHLNSGRRAGPSKLNQDIKSIASKEHLRGRSTMKNSAEGSVPSQRGKGRASTHLRDQ